MLLARVIDRLGLAELSGRDLPFQAVVAVDVGGMPAAIAEQDQADADGDLGRRDREDQDRQDDPAIGPASGRSGPYRQNATRLMLAALSMISIAISTAIALRRISTPARPIANEAAAK